MKPLRRFFFSVAVTQSDIFSPPQTPLASQKGQYRHVIIAIDQMPIADARFFCFIPKAGIDRASAAEAIL